MVITRSVHETDRKSFDNIRKISFDKILNLIFLIGLRAKNV